MKNKRFASTMIAAVSAFCIAMTGMLPVQAAEGTIFRGTQEDYVPRAVGGQVNVAIYGDSSVSVSQDNGKTVMSIRAADMTAAKESNSDVTGNTSGTTSGNMNVDALPPGTTMTQPAEASAVEMTSGNQNGTSTGTQPIYANQEFYNNTGSSGAIFGNQNNGTSTGNTSGSSGTTSGNQNELMFGDSGQGFTLVGGSSGTASDDQNIAVSVGGTTYHGNTNIVLNKNQTVNIAVQDGKGFSLTTEGKQVDPNLIDKAAKEKDMKIIGTDAESLAREAFDNNLQVTLTQDDTKKLCSQLFIVKDKNIIINRNWLDKYAKLTAEISTNIANLKKFMDQGGYTFYDVAIPIESVNSTSDVEELFDRKLKIIQKEMSEAARRGSGGTNTNTASSGGETNVPVTGITISPDNNVVGVGSTVNLTATVSPDNATNKTVNWSSDNPSLASVDSSGTVTGREPTGDKSVTITATAADGSNKTGTATVHVH
jgi:uncharacterized protein YjdB